MAYYAGGATVATTHGVNAHACKQAAVHARLVVRNRDRFRATYEMLLAGPCKLTVAEAFCLMWREGETGNMPGRKCGKRVQALALAGMMLDLVFLGALELEMYDKKRFFGHSKETDVWCTVAGADAIPETCAYLRPLFAKIKAHNAAEGPRSLGGWLQHLVMGWGESGTTYVDAAVESLVAKGVLAKKSVWNGWHFPTADPRAEAMLKEYLRRVVLQGEEPDVFAASLLMLAGTADGCKWGNPFMSSVVTDAELKAAKPRLDAMWRLMQDAA